MKEPVRQRARDLGVVIGRFETGRHNAITDVAGVRVGHVTKVRGHGKLVAGKGPVRTGVTAIFPASGDVFSQRIFAGSYVLNGAGEVLGLLQVDEWGLCETPILLTSTLCVGKVADATISWMSRRHPRIGKLDDVVIPIVSECDDSWLNDAVGRHVKNADVWAALDSAKAGAVVEGSVGAGTGMQTFDFAGGIGTSSRVLPIAGTKATVGALVLSNFGSLERLRVDGVRLGERLAPRFSDLARRGPAGSIVVLIATDLPLFPTQLRRLCRRGALAIGRAGGYVANNSGEFLFAWSTGNRIPRKRLRKKLSVEVVLDTELDPLYEATLDVVEEAIMNALCAGKASVGHSGHSAPALPLEEVARAMGVRTSGPLYT